MIWSIIPEEFLFAAEQAEAELTLTEYLGRRVCLRAGRVERLLSSDPADYLDPRFAPGALVDKG